VAPASTFVCLLANSIQLATIGSKPPLINTDESDKSDFLDDNPFCSSPEKPF